jgi:hypothetical protein
MQIAALLIIVLIFAIFAKPKNPKYYRIAIGSIFGIAFFCIWLFFRYYAQIFAWSDLHTNAGLVTLGVACAIVCSLPWINRINQLGALSLLAVFLISLFVTFAFEHEIKFFIADKASYFDGENPITQHRDNTQTTRFEFKQGGYALEIPQGWTKRQRKDGISTYFTLSGDKNRLAELRLKCFHQLKLALPEIILTIENATAADEQVTHEKHCFRWKQDYAACLIRSDREGGSQPTARWRWFAVNPSLQHGIELDFVVYTMSPELTKNIQDIIGSVEPIALPQPRPVCFTPADWI